MEDAAASLVLVGIPLAVAWMIVRLVEAWTRKRIVESGASPELVEKLYERREFPSRYASLKWGMVAVGLGVGVSVETILPYDFEDPVAYGVLLVSGGLALILYYVYVDREIEPVGGRGGGPDRGPDASRAGSSREPPR